MKKYNTLEPVYEYIVSNRKPEDKPQLLHAFTTKQEAVAFIKTLPNPTDFKLYMEELNHD